jgi:hypothetical protein
VPEYFLIVANPPHQDGFDAVRAAAVFERSPAEIRAKANVPIPEIWMGDPHEGLITGKVAELRQCGLNVLAATSTEFLNVPNANQVEEFLINEHDMTWDFEDDAVELRFPRKLFIVSCRPKLPTGSMSPDGLIGALKRAKTLGHGLMKAAAVGGPIGGIMRMRALAKNDLQRRADRKKIRDSQKALKKALPADVAFLDVYYNWQGTIERMMVVEGTVNYSPLGSMMKGTSRENTKVLGETISTLYGDVHFDRRLENFFYKPSTLQGLVIDRLLETISPVLKGLDPFDLASRLIFLAAPKEKLPTSPLAETPAASDAPPEAGSSADTDRSPGPLPSKSGPNRRTRLSFE